MGDRRRPVDLGDKAGRPTAPKPATLVLGVRPPVLRRRARRGREATLAGGAAAIDERSPTPADAVTGAARPAGMRHDATATTVGVAETRGAIRERQASKTANDHGATTRRAPANPANALIARIPARTGATVCLQDE